MVSAISDSAGVTNLVPVKTRALLPPQDDLWDALDPALPRLQDGDVVAITSKVVAIHQGRCVAADTIADKEDQSHRKPIGGFRRRRQSMALHLRSKAVR